MVIDNTGTVTGGGGAERLREVLEGNPVRQIREQVETPPQETEQQDRVTLSSQLEVAMRTTNDRMARVQERSIANQETLQGLNEIEDELEKLRTALEYNNQQDQANPEVNPPRDTQNAPEARRNTRAQDQETINQAVENIDRIVQNTEFRGERLVEEYSAEELGLTQIQATEQRVEVEQVVEEAQVKVRDRQQEVRQEQEVDRQEMQSLQVGMENISAARSAERIDETREQDVKRAVEAIRQEGPRGGDQMQLTPSRVLELI